MSLNTFFTIAFAFFASIYLILPLGIAIYMRTKYNLKVSSTLCEISEELMKHE